MFTNTRDDLLSMRGKTRASISELDIELNLNLTEQDYEQIREEWSGDLIFITLDELFNKLRSGHYDDVWERQIYFKFEHRNQWFEQMIRHHLSLLDGDARAQYEAYLPATKSAFQNTFAKLEGQLISLWYILLPHDSNDSIHVAIHQLRNPGAELDTITNELQARFEALSKEK